MIGEANQGQYVFEQQESAERATYLTNQLVAFNQMHSTALPLEPTAPSPLQV